MRSPDKGQAPDKVVIRGNADYWTGGTRSVTEGVFRWQSPLDLSEDFLFDLAQLCECPLEDMCRELLRGQVQVYRVGDLFCAVEREVNALKLCAVIQEGAVGTGFRELFLGLRRLARDWGLYKIETEAAAPEVARLLKLFGAHTVKETLRLEV